MSPQKLKSTPSGIVIFPNVASISVVLLQKMHYRNSYIVQIATRASVNDSLPWEEGVSSKAGSFELSGKKAADLPPG